MSLVEKYEENLGAGFTDDPEQRRVVRALERVGCELVEAANKKPSMFKRLLGGDRKDASRGLYVWGGVGRGKTYLMDLFFEWLPIERKNVCTSTGSCSVCMPICGVLRARRIRWNGLRIDLPTRPS